LSAVSLRAMEVGEGRFVFPWSFFLGRRPPDGFCVFFFFFFASFCAGSFRGVLGDDRVLFVYFMQFFFAVGFLRSFCSLFDFLVLFKVPNLLVEAFSYSFRFPTPPTTRHPTASCSTPPTCDAFLYVCVFRVCLKLQFPEVVLGFFS